jgi:predicted PolB exonuclease-like 3'-5' exonuclease
MTVWSCGSRDYVSLDTLAKLCGHPGKNGEGAEFARLWFGTIEEREMAKRYLENDLEMTYRVSRMLGVV